MNEKLNLNDASLVGKYYETNTDQTEFAFQPAEFVILESISVLNEIPLTCNVSGCDNLIRVTEEGNSQYAWYYLNNSGSKYADVTIERRWMYEGKWRRETILHKLYPGERREVFSFPRNQQPLCCIIVCAWT